MSANVLSVFRKYSSPPTSIAITATTDTIRIGPGGVALPSSAQRKPSTTPAMGFSPSSARHGSGTRLLGYATGVANIQLWVRKGIVYRTSLYFTLSADSHRPTASAV